MNLTIGLAIVALAAVVRLQGVGWGLPQVYEEATPLKRAWEMWGWGPNRTFDLNPHFFNYPSLVIYLQFLGQVLLYPIMKVTGMIGPPLDFRIAYAMDKTPFYLMGRTLITLLGLLTVWATYDAGRRIGGRAAGAVAALALSVSAFHIEKSQVVEVDVPLTAFVMLSFAAMVRLMDAPTRRNYILAGLFMGLATSAKYTGALLILPLLAAYLLSRRSVASPAKRARVPSGHPLGNLVLALLTMIVVFVATSPFVIIDATTFWQHFSTEREHMRLGHFGLSDKPTWLFYLGEIGSHQLGWPFAVLCVFGMAYAAVRRRRWALVFFAFIVPYAIAISTWSMRADRYALPVLPMLFLFAATLMADIWRHSRVARIPYGVRATGAVVVVALMCAPLAIAYGELVKRRGSDTRTLAKAWIEANVPAGSFVVMEGYGPELFGPQQLWTQDVDVRENLTRRLADEKVYGVLPLQMFQTMPERSEVYYDLSLYRLADVVVTSSSIKSRYTKEPDRFPTQSAFYDSLNSRFQKLQEFKPDGGSGPTIAVYKNPDQQTPFRTRRVIDRPPVLAKSRYDNAREELFYLNLGLNYETFGHPRQAYQCYQLANRYPVYQPAVFKALALGMARCLVALGKVSEAASFLEQAAAATPSAADRQHFLNVRAQLLSQRR